MKIDDLTEDEIRDLEPGQDLDDLVAREVMGWFDMGEHVYWRSPGGDVVASYDTFRPSTDIASAWRVLALLSRTETLVAIRTLDVDGEIGWVVHVGGVVTMRKCVAHAICITAIRARMSADS